MIYSVFSSIFNSYNYQKELQNLNLWGLKCKGVPTPMPLLKCIHIQVTYFKTNLEFIFERIINKCDRKHNF